MRLKGLQYRSLELVTSDQSAEEPGVSTSLPNVPAMAGLDVSYYGWGIAGTFKVREPLKDTARYGKSAAQDCWPTTSATAGGPIFITSATAAIMPNTRMVRQMLP
ncbi:MAG: hypothetical protein U1F16_10115 [Turneriella sp.]